MNNINELTHKTMLPDNIIFKLKLFHKLQKNFFRNTPESDSLYRRRNKLIILGISIAYYSYTHYYINDYKVLFKSKISKRISIFSLKLILLSSLILIPQLILKYIFYLNKVYKSYQFALEGVLRYNIILSNSKNNEFLYLKDFDILDNTNIKKHQ